MGDRILFRVSSAEGRAFMMKRKPDVMLVLLLIFALGAALSNITVGGTSPQEVAQAISIR